jgi:hypothetical protein
MSFPRKEGKCKLFRIPNEVFYTTDEVYEVSEVGLAKGLEYLQNEDLVFGDLVEYEYVMNGEPKGRYRNDGLVIYDGEKLVNLYRNLDEYGSLHIIFQVIRKGVPLDYWNDFIDHNYYVWFDISPVYEEINDNIDREGESIFTYFHYENEKYYIALINNGEGKSIEEFKEYLLKSPVLPFSIMDTYLDIDFSPDTLYLELEAVDEWLHNVKNEPEYELYKIEKLFENYFSK